MGVEKGSLSVKGKSLYSFPLGVLESLCDEILVSICSKKAAISPHRQVCDLRDGLGPMGGLFSCLKQSSNEINLVLSYDMPMVNEGLFRYLIKHLGDHDMVLPAMHPDRPEPLCGIYRKGMHKVFGELIENGRYAVHMAMHHADASVLPISKDLPFYHPRLFMNINDPADMKALHKILEDEH